MKKFYFLALMAIVAVSCEREIEKELVFNETPIAEPVAIDGSIVVPIDEALNNLDEL